MYWLFSHSNFCGSNTAAGAGVDPIERKVGDGVGAVE